jgi:type III pantothenate kinase
LNLAIDIGNTRIKTGVFDQDNLVYAQIYDRVDSVSLQSIINDYGVTHVIVASTGADLESEVVEAPGVFLRFSSMTPVPIENHYKSPETLGHDRLAGMVAASWLHPGSNVLVIDAGTCITFDLLEETGKYVGGNIAPGLDMRYNAMHQFTQRLPAVERADAASLLGETTQEALQNGGLMGILMEIAGYIEILRSKYNTLHTLLTGGDAQYLAEHLNTKLAIQPHLILIGLNQILQFNVAKYN